MIHLIQHLISDSDDYTDTSGKRTSFPTSLQQPSIWAQASEIQKQSKSHLVIKLKHLMAASPCMFTNPRR